MSGEALPWDADVADASPFDVAPGTGFDDNAVAVAIKPLPGRLSGSGAALLLDPAQNNAYKALNAAWDAGATVRYSSAQGGRYVVTGWATGPLDDWSTTWRCALPGGRPPARPSPGPASASTAPGPPAWTKGGAGGSWSGTASPSTSVRDADLRAGDLGDRYDVLVLPAERGSSLKDGFSKGSVPDRVRGRHGRPRGSGRWPRSWRRAAPWCA